ncbi:hypothetical protein OD785_23195, partial [Pseudomonas aeruginosa]|nr:hypothetical protein [Pseudomonas aeruginosa]
MKDVVQIKAELFEGQHDALIAFYETYPRLFVNKLLLRLCEAFMPAYKPNLSFFRPHPAAPGAKSRKIAIRVRIPRHSDTQPTLIRTPVPRSFGQAV